MNCGFFKFEYIGAGLRTGSFFFITGDFENKSFICGLQMLVSLNILLEKEIHSVVLLTNPNGAPIVT